MKVCNVCKQEKPETEFYNIKAQPDGLDYYCQLCRAAKSKQYEESGERKVAESTQMVYDQMQRRGIPSGLGRLAGMPYTDIVAYGSIQVEAKGAKPHYVGSKGQEHYTFHFTAAQREKYTRGRVGFIVLVAMGEKTRYFVVPASDPMFDFSLSSFCVALNPTENEAQSRSSKMLRFENAFHLINEAVMQIAQPKAERAKRARWSTQAVQPALF